LPSSVHSTGFACILANTGAVANSNAMAKMILRMAVSSLEMRRAYADGVAQA
jgi:hypothetical protein